MPRSIFPGGLVRWSCDGPQQAVASWEREVSLPLVFWAPMVLKRLSGSALRSFLWAVDDHPAGAWVRVAGCAVSRQGAVPRSPTPACLERYCVPPGSGTGQRAYVSAWCRIGSPGSDTSQARRIVCTTATGRRSRGRRIASGKGTCSVQACPKRSGQTASRPSCGAKKSNGGMGPQSPRGGWT